MGMIKIVNRSILFLCCLGISYIHAQTASNFETKPVAFRSGNKVFLRWSVSTAAQWRQANILGYNVERAEEGSTNFQLLNTTPLKPITLLAAQKYGRESAVYIVTSLIQQKPDPKDKNRSDDSELYGYYLLMSSYNADAASLSASAYTDSTTVPGKKYTYRITVATIAPEKQQASTVTVQDDNTLPALPSIVSKFMEKTVNLEWNIKPVIDDYIAVVVERSTDSINFSTITNPPLLSNLQNANEKEKDTTKKMMIFNDADVAQNTKYYYRIKGINVFGINSEPGTVISGICLPDIRTLPKIKSIDTLAGKFVVNWTMPDSVKRLVKQYEIRVSQTGDDSTYKKIFTFPATKDSITAFDFKPSQSNYFTLRAINQKADQYVESFPYLYQLNDSIPPALPVGLNGVIDKSGNVTLAWSGNKEPDILAYKVYRSFSNTGSYSLITGEPTIETIFKEKLPLNQLNADIFYKVSALDNRYNESALSEPIRLSRPDTIPPAIATLLEVNMVNNKSMEVKWKKSFSKDVVSYALFRKDIDDSLSTWIQIATPDAMDSVYSDLNVDPTISYAYKIQAVDKGDLKSGFSNERFYKAPAKAAVKVKILSNLNAYTSRGEKKYIELNWNINRQIAENIREFWVYRVVNGNEAEIALQSVIPGTSKIFDDDDVRENTRYTYYIKAVYKTGGSSDLEKINVDY